MLIRTGILSVPHFDESAVNDVLDVITSGLSNVLLLQNSSAASQRNWIEETLRTWADEEELDLLITIGGTAPAPGPSSAEIVPDATATVIERSLPGLAEAMRSYAALEMPLAWLERCNVGIRGRSLIINLPAGEPAALFLEGIVELLEPLFVYLGDDTQSLHLPASTSSHLHSESARPSMDASQQRPQGLDANEFAMFLKRNQS